MQSHSENLISETVGFETSSDTAHFFGKYILAVSRLACVPGCGQKAPCCGCKAAEPSRGTRAGTGAHLSGGTTACLELSRGGRLGLQVLQQPLAAGGGAVLVQDGLGLSHQEVGEQDAARLEHLWKTKHPVHSQHHPEQESRDTAWHGQRRHMAPGTEPRARHPLSTVTRQEHSGVKSLLNAWCWETWTDRC